MRDAITLESPKRQNGISSSTHLLEDGGRRVRNGKPGEPALEVSIVSPQNVAVTTGAATVKAPGAPGSIEKEFEEQHGHVLRAVAPAAESVGFEVTLEIVAPRDPSRRDGS